MIKTYKYIVKPGDTATFHGKEVHPVCATFVLAREIEWATRRHIFELLHEGEEGIGTHLDIDHSSPAHVGEELVITSQIEDFTNGNLTCSYKVAVGDRTIAQGRTGQKIMPKVIIEKIFSNLKDGEEGK